MVGVSYERGTPVGLSGLCFVFRLFPFVFRVSCFVFLVLCFGSRVLGFGFGVYKGSSRIRKRYPRLEPP